MAICKIFALFVLTIKTGGLKMYRKNNNIFTTMIANQLFSNYSFKHKMPTSLNSLNSKIEAKQKPNNVNKYLQEIKQESESIQRERRESIILSCLLEKTIEKRTKKIYKICKNLEKNLSEW